jgi:hypothetical protein
VTHAVFECVRAVDVGREDPPKWAVKIVWQRGASVEERHSLSNFWERECVQPLELRGRLSAHPGGQHLIWTEDAYHRTQGGLVTIFCVMERSPCAHPFGVDVSDGAEQEPTLAARLRAIPDGYGGRGSGADLTDSKVTPLPLSPTVASLVVGHLLKALSALHSVGLMHRVSQHCPRVPGVTSAGAHAAPLTCRMSRRRT